jgi:hypothetical protein
VAGLDARDSRTTDQVESFSGMLVAIAQRNLGPMLKRAVIGTHTTGLAMWALHFQTS